MKVNKSICAAAIFLWIIVLPSFASEKKDGEGMMTIADAIMLAKNNPQALQAIAQYHVANAERDAANWALYPQLNIGYSDNISQLTGNNEQDAVLSASYRVLDGGRARNSVLEKQQIATSALYTAQAEQDRLITETIQSYLDIVRFTKLSSLAAENVSRHLEVRRLISEIAKVDPGRRSDQMLVDGRLATAKTTLTHLVQQLKISRQNFIALVGQAPGIIATPEFTDAYRIHENANVSNWLAQAELYSPVLKSQLARIDAAEAQVNATKNWYVPNVDVEAKQVLPIGSGSRKQDTVFGVNVTWNTTDRFSGVDLSNAAKMKKIGELEGAAALKRQLTTTVENLFSQLTAIRSKQSATAIQRSSLEEVSDTYWEQFRIGRRTLLDALNTESDLFSSKIEESSLLYDDLFYQLQLYVIQGRMNEVLDSLKYKLSSD